MKQSLNGALDALGEGFAQLLDRRLFAQNRVAVRTDKIFKLFPGLRWAADLDDLLLALRTNYGEFRHNRDLSSGQ